MGAKIYHWMFFYKTGLSSIYNKLLIKSHLGNNCHLKPFKLKRIPILQLFNSTPLLILL
jgi:hypothetical protein